MTKTRQRLDPEARAAQLMTHGIDWFANQQGDTQSMAAFGKQYNVSTGLLYHYHANKRVFFLACQQHVLDQWFVILTDQSAQTAMQQLTLGLQAFLNHGDTSPEIFRTFIAHPTLMDEEVFAQIQTWQHNLSTWLLERLGYPTTPSHIFASTCWVGTLLSACSARLSLDDAQRPGIPNTATYLQHMLTTHLSLAPSMLAIPPLG